MIISIWYHQMRVESFHYLQCLSNYHCNLSDNNSKGNYYNIFKFTFKKHIENDQNLKFNDNNRYLHYNL